MGGTNQNPAGNLTYDVFVDEFPPPQDGLPPNGEPKLLPTHGQHADLRDR